MKKATVCILSGAVFGALLVSISSSVHEAPRSPKWPAVRDRHLKRFPTCAVCGGKDNLQVHHVLPFALFPALELDEGNLITLCEKPSRNCHLCFGHCFEFNGGWNSHVREDAALMLSRKAESDARIK